MMKLYYLLILTPCLAQAASKIYTGFNYGAFWSVQAEPKSKADFLDGFNLTKSLNTPIPFDSARLFTCVQAGTKDEPSEAFGAAVETKTNLLLGFWISPANRGDPPDENVKNEMAALQKGFNKYGQTLADLVIGLAVGNEDIYRWEATNTSGLSADVVSKTIDEVKKDIAGPSFGNYMKDKPIGHVDIAKYCVLGNADFIGMTAYPYWNNESIADAYTSFHGSLENVKQRAVNTPVWITEMGWPFAGMERDKAVASPENVQKFWTDVGCTVFGKYTTFWFELLKDSNDPGDSSLDWGLVEKYSRQPRIKDLSCPDSLPSAPVSPSAGSQVLPVAAPTIPPNSNTSSTLSSQSPAPSLSVSSQPAAGTFAPAASSTIDPMSEVQSTVHVNTTIYITVRPTAPLPGQSSANVEEVAETVIKDVTVTVTTTIFVKRTPSPSQTPIPIDRPWCNTVADIDRNGKLVTIAGGPAGPDGKCSTPPTYNGFPYGTSDPSVKSTHVPVGTPLCVTMADIDRNGRPVPVSVGPAGPDGKCSAAPTYTGWPYVGASTADTPSSIPPTPPSSAIIASSSAPSSNSAIVSSAAPALPVSSPQPSPPQPARSQPIVSSPSFVLLSSSNPVQSGSFSVHSYCLRKSSRLSQSSAVIAPSTLPASSNPASATPPTTPPQARRDASMSQFNWPQHSTASNQSRRLSFLRSREERVDISERDCEEES